jgi:tripartite-type tricarboxylate transporter receptor subunit TctC
MARERPQKNSIDGATPGDLFHVVGHAIAMWLGLFAILASVSVATGSEYPDRVIKLIVPNAAGGPADVFARIVAEALGGELGQSVIVENRTGAGGITAYAMAANATPDGYTLVIVDPSIAILPSLYSDLTYDVEKDLIPISLIVRGTTVLVARNSLDANSPVELVALAKREPSKLTYGSAGIGSFPHLNAELFKLANGVDMRHVPYRGGAPALTDLVAGRIDLSFLNVGTVKTYIEDGSIKALAVSGNQRTGVLPNVPTYYEAGLPMPQFDRGSWWGIMGPARIPAEIQSKLHEAVGKALKNPQLLKRFEEMGANTRPSTPREFSELIKSERSKWADVVKWAGIKPE